MPGTHLIDPQALRAAEEALGKLAEAQLVVAKAERQARAEESRISADLLKGHENKAFWSF